MSRTHLGVREAARSRQGVSLHPSRHAPEDASLGARANQLHVPHMDVHTCLGVQAPAAGIAGLVPRCAPVAAPTPCRGVLQGTGGQLKGLCRGFAAHMNRSQVAEARPPEQCKGRQLVDLGKPQDSCADGRR